MDNSHSINTPEGNQSLLNTTDISPAKKPNIFIPVIATLLVGALVFGLGGYFLGKQYSVSKLESVAQNDSNSKTTVNEENTTTPSSSKPATSTIDVNEDQSTLIPFPECGTKFSIPERKSHGNEPYWQAPRGVSYPDLLGLINPKLIDKGYSQFAAMYTSDDAASGYIEAAVVVSCINFRMNITMNYEILNSLIFGVEEYNKKTLGKGMGPETYRLNHMPLYKWGRDVFRIMLNEDEYYTFVGKGGVYEVKAFGEGKDSKIIQERQRILDTLKFE